MLRNHGLFAMNVRAFSLHQKCKWYDPSAIIDCGYTTLNWIDLCVCCVWIQSKVEYYHENMAEFRSLQRQLESVVSPESLVIIQNCVDKNVRVHLQFIEVWIGLCISQVLSKNRKF